jgi:AcrR family transcriptional regulator
MDFQRARSDEQREQRRRVIFDTAAAMLAEMPVADITLNELSRRVGLAKSNVLRYFESREAVLLELLNAELHAWIVDMDFSGISSRASHSARAKALADVIAASLVERPVLCDLVGAQAAVLERNVSSAVVLKYKRTTADSVLLLSSKLASRLPELAAEELYHLIAVTLLMTSAAWPHSQPSEAVQAAYAEDPAIASHQLSFGDFLRETLALTLTGLLAKHASSSKRSTKH